MNTFNIVKIVNALRNGLAKELESTNTGSVITEQQPNSNLPFSLTNRNCITLGIANSSFHNDSSRVVNVSLEPQKSLDGSSILPMVAVSYERKVPGKPFAETRTRHYMPSDAVDAEGIHATTRFLKEHLLFDVFNYLIHGTNEHVEMPLQLKTQLAAQRVKLHNLPSVGTNPLNVSF
jgi:hypothetical protein